MDANDFQLFQQSALLLSGRLEQLCEEAKCIRELLEVQQADVRAVKNAINQIESEIPTLKNLRSLLLKANTE